MNMSIIKSNQIQPNLNSLIAEEVLAVAQVNVAEHEKIANAKQFLDRLFPLNSGSHQDVSSYVVYYQHLLAFLPTAATAVYVSQNSLWLLTALKMRLAP